MPQDPVEDEPTRLRRVYGDYAADDRARARWDADQPGNRLILAERDQLVRRAMAEIRATHDGAAPCTVVDLGCGEAGVLASLVGPADAGGADGWSPVGIGIDLLEERLRSAHAAHPSVPLVAADGTALPFARGSVDAMVVFTVFSSIADPATARAVAAEIGRVTRPGGRVLWYDLRRNNPRNPEVHGLSTAAVAELFPGWTRSLRPCTVLPPLARRAASVWTGSYRALACVPPLRSHLFGVLRAPTAGSGGRP